MIKLLPRTAANDEQHPRLTALSCYHRRCCCLLGDMLHHVHGLTACAPLARRSRAFAGLSAQTRLLPAVKDCSSC